jgi:hypothetical protein
MFELYLYRALKNAVDLLPLLLILTYALVQNRWIEKNPKTPK